MPWPNRRCEIAVPADQLDKFSILRERFGLRLATARPDDPSLTPFVTIDHETPSTALGAVVRPLIFPRAIVDHCRTLWPAARPHRYSFAGLLTDSRRALLEGWMAGSADGAAGLAAKTSFGGFVRRQLIRWRGADRQRRIGDVTVWSSERGRRFPTKAWDEEYFQLLADSEHVLCPSGDYQWSYRFFEACLCGAVPIVEEASPLYDGLPLSADDRRPRRGALVGRRRRAQLPRVRRPDRGAGRRARWRARPPRGAAAAGGQRGSITQRTAAVVNSRVRRLAISRSGRIGSSSKLANRSGLASTSRMKRLMVILFRPLSSMVRGSVGLVQGPPPHQRPLREQQVREGEHRVDVAAERVIPGRPEGRQHLAARPQQAAHVRQHGGRIGEVLERVERDDQIDGIAPFARERAAIRDAARVGVLDRRDRATSGADRCR